jgi:hypothetical protein
MPTPTRFRTKLPVLGVLALALVVTLAIAIPNDTSASHNFSDVPDSMIFHEEVGRIKDAGITTGCGGGKYCPWDPVSRLAMAAFMNRGFGRVAMNNSLIDGTINVTDNHRIVGGVVIVVPGSGASATQFVEVRGRVVAYDSLASCASTPCTVQGYIWDPTLPGFFAAKSATAFKIFDTIEASWVFAATPGAHAYYLVLVTDAVADLDLSEFVMTATTYPFGAAGGNVLFSAPGANATALDTAVLDSNLPDVSQFEGELEAALDASRQ